MTLPAIVLSTGEPAGIGPDLCLSIARDPWPARLVAVGDIGMLGQRARQLDLDVELRPLSSLTAADAHHAGTLQIVHQPLRAAVQPGQLDPANAADVLRILDTCADACLAGDATAMVTAPLHKGIINDAGVAFSGHTEYLAARCAAPLPVMLLCAGTLRVALATTHLPLREVSDALSQSGLTALIRVLNADLTRLFGLQRPRIGVCGLNPHAGEGGHLGSEEQEVIDPVLTTLRAEGIDLSGPLPADTIFTPRVLQRLDAVLAMYHDQGLPVLKYAGFGNAVNVTLGLPIVRTSVDHGTALDLAGRGTASDSSLRAALNLALELGARDAATSL